MKKYVNQIGPLVFLILIVSCNRQYKISASKNCLKETKTIAVANTKMETYSVPQIIKFITQDRFANNPRNLNYQIRPNYYRRVKQEKLNTAKLMSDIISDYPSNWILEHVSAEILATCNGKSMRAAGPNDTLSAEQRNILNTADLATTITIYVKYKSENTFSNKIEENMLFVTMMVVPEKEAEYAGGNKQMREYLKEDIIDKIFETIPEKFQQVEIVFNVNEEGEIADAKISRSTGDAKIDKLILTEIDKMPKWIPAENAGIKVKQEFVFSVGKGGC